MRSTNIINPQSSNKTQRCSHTTTTTNNNFPSEGSRIMKRRSPPSRPSSNASTKKVKWWNDLETLFTIVLIIFFLGTSYNMYLVHLHEEQIYTHRRYNNNGRNPIDKIRHKIRSRGRGGQKHLMGWKNHKIHKMSEFIDKHQKQQKQQHQQKVLNKKSYKLHNDILQAIDEKKLRPYSADSVWEDLIKNGQQIMERNNYSKHLTVIEVGAQNENQSLMAAHAKYNVHCVEPSPKSFVAIHGAMKKKFKLAKDEESQKYIRFYNVAAGDVSGKTIDFYSTGGTGDHVGEFDMWNMKPGKMPDDWPEEKRGKMVQVPSIQLDDMIYYNKIKPTVVEGFDSKPVRMDDVYALKVDTQGFEPSVFAGLKKSIREHKIQYIMTEYWPKGMGLMANKMDKPCEAAEKVFDILSDAGYKLYALPMQGHPSAWGFTKTIFHHVANWKKRPLDDYRKDCQHILNFEKEFPNPNYHMGYWSDVLAIAPESDPFVPKKKPKHQRS